MSTMAGFVVGLIAGISNMGGIELAWVGFLSIWGRSYAFAKFRASPWMIAVEPALIALWWAVGTYMISNTPLEFRRAAGAGGLIGVFATIAVGTQLSGPISKGNWPSEVTDPGEADADGST